MQNNLAGLIAEVLVVGPVMLNAGCAAPSHVDQTLYKQKIGELSTAMTRDAGTSLTWPYGSDATLCYNIGARGDTTEGSAFYEKLEHVEALSLYGLFITARRESGFSNTDAKNCTVYLSDPSGKIVARCEENGVESTR